MGQGLFYECCLLQSVTIPDGVTIFNYVTFYGCSSLNRVYYTGTEEQWNSIDKTDNSKLNYVTIIYNYVNG